MARDSRAILDRRNARARELGFTSYAQQRRSKVEGFTDAGAYQATVEARHNPTSSVIRAVTNGKLLGGQATQTGAVFAADFGDDEQIAAQWRAMLRYKPSRRASISVEMESGTIRHLGASHGGYRLSYLRELERELGSWPAVILYLIEIVKKSAYKNPKTGAAMPADDDEPDEDSIEIVTVTIV